MPRVVILCEFPTLLGGERSMLATLPAIMADGFEVVVGAPSTGPLTVEVRRRGIPHCEWKTRSDTGERLPLEEIRSGLADLLTQTSPDLVHANSLSGSRISGPVVLHLGIASVGHLRDILRLSAQAVLDLNAHSRLIAVSHATREFHIGQGIDAEKCVVVYNGVDLKAFQPRARTKQLHAELNLAPDARLIAIVGQLSLRKGTDVAIAAARRIAPRFPDVHWLIVGERSSRKVESVEFEQSLRVAAEILPLSGHVHFLGQREDMSEILNECDLLVHAARQEPLGRVLLEAASCGVAIIATDVGGTREIFPPEANAAVLVSPDDEVAIANAAMTLLDDQSWRTRLGENARRRAEAAFDIDIAARNLIAQYRGVLDNYGDASGCSTVPELRAASRYNSSIRAPELFGRATRIS